MDIQPAETVIARESRDLPVDVSGKGGIMQKEKKADIIRELRDKFLRARSVVFTEYSGMTVSEMSELRDLLRDFRIEYRVIKNNLARIAAEDTPVSVVGRDAYVGPLGLAIGYDDPLLVVKKILEFSEKNEKLKVRPSVVEGRLLGIEELKEISNLPPREILLSMLLGAMESPLSRFASLLNATVTNFAYALEALRRKKEESTK